MTGYLRGVAFYAVCYLSMGLAGALFFPVAAVSGRAARACAKLWIGFMFAALRLIGGVRAELRGPLPTGRVLVAAKHQSMLDVFILVHALPEARFVMKRELTRAPVFGWYALRLGCVPVDRGGGRPALESMVREMVAKGADGGQMVIYPQGTRVAPGASAPYKIGVHALYAATDRPCVPAATNAGRFWPKGLRLNPGVAVVSFLPEIAPGLPREAFMAQLEAAIEAEATALARD